MAASSWKTWDKPPGFSGYAAMGPNGVGQALDSAIRHKEAASEQSMGGGYEFGSYQKRSGVDTDTRFAGAELLGQLNGEFGQVANPVPGAKGQIGEHPAFPHVKRFMQSYLGGMFGPGLAEGAEGAPPPNA